MNATFTVFTRNKISFLLIPNGPNCAVCDAEGNNYGTYFDQTSFEAMAKREGGFEKLRLGKVQISFQNLGQ
jgi:hypothetical protein